jgi:heme/copper-type cytochrome/quinol oxidase subunit 3
MSAEADLKRKSLVISGRAKRVIVYTAALLIAPMPVMPYERGTREYVPAIMVCSIILILSSFYVARGEMKLTSRSLVGNKLLAASLITLLFGILMLLGASVYLVESKA